MSLGRRAARGWKARDLETDTGLAFGDLLRRHRDSAGLTQEDLAERTGLTPQAISLLERSVRRRPHRYTVQKLAEALGLEGQELAGFETASRRPPASRSETGPTRRSLPISLTPLIGREQEVEAVIRLLCDGDVRLLTLTGPGGVGKTRLAVEVARRSGGEFEDGAVFVPLAPVREPGLIPPALAEALGIRDVADQSLQETLKLHLRDARMLLLLDNFEHLLEAVPLVSDLVAACPRLTVLATSRTPLRISGEHQFPVHPLPLPDTEAPAPGKALERSPALELFRQRAKSVTPDFEVTDTNAEAVARICRRLDGLPLAIELAAARVKLFSPHALLERLDRRLNLLVGGARDLPDRQRTLRDTVAWSYDLLDPDEQILFQRLSVFAGGCSLEAAEAVCGSGPDRPEVGDVLEMMAALVDNSLLEARSEVSAGGGDEGPRFEMLETIREYAAERLESGGEAEAMRRAHALYYLSLAEATQPEVSARMLKEWIAILGRDHDNLRAALGWAIRRGEVDVGVQLGLMMWRFWAEHYHLGEGRRWLEAVLALDRPEVQATGDDPTLPARRWAFLHLVTGILSAGQRDFDRAVALYEESLALYRELGHERGASGPLRELGEVAYLRGDYDRAVALGEQAFAISREYGSAFGSGLAVCTLSDALRARGDLERARTLLEESLVSLRRQEYPLRVANALANTLSRLGSIACEMGGYARASGLFRESLDLALRFGFMYDALICLEGMARTLAMQDQPERAARLLGVSNALREEIGTTLTPIARSDHDHAVKAARAALGEDAFAAAWGEGRAMSLEAAVADALDDDV
jgi:predicted ATPase/transcriptional regulator with XRE-family HTH domain